MTTMRKNVQDAVHSVQKIYVTYLWGTFKCAGNLVVSVALLFVVGGGNFIIG